VSNVKVYNLWVRSREFLIFLFRTFTNENTYICCLFSVFLKKDCWFAYYYSFKFHKFSSRLCSGGGGGGGGSTSIKSQINLVEAIDLELETMENRVQIGTSNLPSETFGRVGHTTWTDGTVYEVVICLFHRAWCRRAHPNSETGGGVRAAREVFSSSNIRSKNNAK